MAKCPRCGSKLVHQRWEPKKTREIFRCSGCQALTAVPPGYFKEKREDVRKLCAYPPCKARLTQPRTGRPRTYCRDAHRKAHGRLQANAEEAS